MKKLLKTISIIIVLFLSAQCIYAQEITEAEYLQLKNRLKSDFMQKLKEEIKNELTEELQEKIKKEFIEELKAEYTIEPKQKLVTAKPETTIEINNPQKESKEVYTQKGETIKNTEYPKEVGEIELDKARYKLGEGLTFGEQLLVIRGFGNVNARYRDNNPSERFESGDNFFSLGEFDLFMTSKLSNRISFLNETVFEFDRGENTEERTEPIEIDIERLLIHYDINNLLKIDVGKFFLPLGYWIPTYNHGVWFQTTMDRPDIVNFQDKGGPMPTHDTGIKIYGSALLEGFDLNYACAISNGRGVNTTQRQNFRDINDKKAISLQLDIQPHILEGVRLGPSVYYDVIPEDKTEPNRENELREIIYGGHIVYTFRNIDLLTEVFEINHDEFSGGVFNTIGGYAQFAYTINKFKPYYRYDYIDYSNDDPFYRESELDFLDTSKHTIGLRYELSHFNALKFEYSHGVFDDKDVNVIGLQTTFSF
ncbi:MAG: hypothetical protein HYV59_14065 [Planctomycetes bacterium]|nr:hypothetical protein [Planctomycetota bacterium]